MPASNGSVTAPREEGQVTFSTADFQRWWRSERGGALLLACPTTPWMHPEALPIVGELALLAKVKRSHRKAMLHSVFEGSQRLGEVISRRLGRPLAFVELTEILSHADVPCLAGRWTAGTGGEEWRLERRGCSTRPPAIVCDYWREAIRGLIQGLGRTARLERVESLGHGGTACVDLICGPRCRMGASRESEPQAV